ncbi:MAG: DUF4340 domain-containing protein [Candidatus Hydrogenedentota bacterium]
MKFRSTILLALFFAVLCAGYWVLTARDVTEERAIEQAARFFDFTDGDVRAIEITRPESAPVAARRADAETWTFQAPREDIRPDHTRWQKLAETLATLRRERTIGPADDRARYGLDEPALVINVRTGADEETHTIAFGAAEPLQINRYAQVDDGPVTLVGNNTYNRLALSLTDLRDTRLFIAGREGVERITFARIWNGRGDPPPGPPPELGEELARVVAERPGGAETWRVVHPKRAPADIERVQGLLQQALNATGERYVDAPEDLSDYGLDPPWARLTLKPADFDEPQTVLLGTADMAEGGEGSLFAKHADSGSVFAIDPYLVNYLPLNRTHFRDRRLLTRPVRGLERIVYKDAQTTFTLEKEPQAGWQMTAPARSRADDAAVSSLVSMLLSVEAMDFPGGAPGEYGLDQPALTLELGFEDEPAEVTLRFAPGDGEAVYATQDTGDVAVVSKDALEVLRRDADDLRSFELMRFNKADAIKIALLDRGDQYELENRAGRWRVTMPADVHLQNQSDVETMLDVLSPVKAEASMVTGESLAEFGLEPPAFSILVYVLDEKSEEGQRRVGPLYIGAPVEDQPQRRYATAAGRGGVYIVRQDVLDRLRAAMRGLEPVSPES